MVIPWSHLGSPFAYNSQGARLEMWAAVEKMKRSHASGESQIEVHSILGRGAFGVAYKGKSHEVMVFVVVPDSQRGHLAVELPCGLAGAAAITKIGLQSHASRAVAIIRMRLGPIHQPLQPHVCIHVCNSTKSPNYANQLTQPTDPTDRRHLARPERCSQAHPVPTARLP